MSNETQEIQAAIEVAIKVMLESNYRVDDFNSVIKSLNFLTQFLSDLKTTAGKEETQPDGYAGTDD